jgi:cell division protein FtsB
VTFARRLLWPMFVCVVLAGVLFLGVFPMRTYLNQRNESNQSEARLAELHKRTGDLEAIVAKLKTPEAVERLAREQYHLVKPGETAFAVLPGSTTNGSVPSGGVNPGGATGGSSAPRGPSND